MGEVPGPLGEVENERIFGSEILPRYLGLIPPARSVRQPVGIVMGGQMGAGKSRLSALLARGTSPAAIVVDADEFRELHPAYADLKRSDPVEAVHVTGPDSGIWTEKLVSALARRKAHLVVEGTMRRPEPFRDTASLLRQHGYSVEAAVLAVSPLVSWQGTIQRAEELHALGEGMRVVERRLHDAAVEGLPEEALPPLERVLMTHAGCVVFETLTGEVVDPSVAGRFYPGVQGGTGSLVWATRRWPTHDELVHAWPARTAPGAAE